MDPELRKERHGEVYYFLRLGNNDRRLLQAPKLGTLAAVMAFDIMRRCFALYQLVLWHDRRIRGPFVWAIQLHMLLRRVIDHLLQRGFVPPPTCPIEEVAGITIQDLPDPQLPSLLLERVPHLISLEDDASPRGLWLLIVLLRESADPLSTDCTDTRRRHAMQCIDTPLRDNRTVLIFIVRGFRWSRGHVH